MDKLHGLNILWSLKIKMDKVQGLNICWSLKIEMDRVHGFWSNSPSIDNMKCN